jgi:putative transposase
MSRTRRTFGKDFKAKVVLEALKEKRYHRGISKKSTSCCPIKFQCGSPKDNNGILQFFSAEKRSLPKMKFQQRNSTLGQLILRMTFKKSLLVSISERVKMVDTQNKLSIVKQCRLLKNSSWRSYYKAKQESLENLKIMQLLDQQYNLFYGCRKLTFWLKDLGFKVNRKRVRRLMQIIN